jgi:hypothetical protein
MNGMRIDGKEKDEKDRVYSFEGTVGRTQMAVEPFMNNGFVANQHVQFQHTTINR